MKETGFWAGLRKYGVSGLFLGMMMIGSAWVVRSQKSVDLSTKRGLYDVDLRAVIIGLLLAYLVLIGVGGFWRLVAPKTAPTWATGRRFRLWIVGLSLLLAGLNGYNQQYHPRHYAQKTVTRYLRTRDAGQLQRVSWSPQTLRVLQRASAVTLTREDAGSNRYLNYRGRLNDQQRHRVDVTISRHRVDPLGLWVRYAVQTVEVMA